MMPRGGGPPTATGLPASDGSARTAAEANMASISPKRICLVQRTDMKGLCDCEWEDDLRAGVGRLYLVQSSVVLCNDHLTQRSPTGPAAVPSRLDGPALPSIDVSALLAAPGILGQGGHLSAKRVVDRDAEAVLIHPHHHAAKIGAMVRAALQDIVLPLMDHFMRECGQGLAALVRAVPMEEDRREFDATSGRIARSLGGDLSRSDPADEHAGGGGQPPAPFDSNRRQGTAKIAGIEVGPDRKSTRLN